jgi:hypothetical protein
LDYNGPNMKVVHPIWSEVGNGRCDPRRRATPFKSLNTRQIYTVHRLHVRDDVPALITGCPGSTQARPSEGKGTFFFIYAGGDLRTQKPIGVALLNKSTHGTAAPVVS